MAGTAGRSGEMRWGIPERPGASSSGNIAQSAMERRKMNWPAGRADHSMMKIIFISLPRRRTSRMISLSF